LTERIAASTSAAAGRPPSATAGGSGADDDADEAEHAALTSAHERSWRNALIRLTAADCFTERETM